jgi:hypothetical protein
MTKHFLYLNEFGDALLVKHEGDNTLRTLQTLVEGFIQCVPTNDTETGFCGDIWVNEEGLYQPTFAANMLASILAGQCLVGPAVITRSNDEGETVGLADTDMKAIQRKGLVVDDNNGEGWTADDAAALRARIVEGTR